MDLALGTSLRRDVLTLLHAAAPRRAVAMGHDYNLPLGPWGVREAGCSGWLKEFFQKTPVVGGCWRVQGGRVAKSK